MYNWSAIAVEQEAGKAPLQNPRACHSRLLGMNDEWTVKMYSLIKKRVIGKS